MKMCKKKMCAWFIHKLCRIDHHQSISYRCFDGEQNDKNTPNEWCARDGWISLHFFSAIYAFERHLTLMIPWIEWYAHSWDFTRGFPPTIKRSLWPFDSFSTENILLHSFAKNASLTEPISPNDARKWYILIQHSLVLIIVSSNSTNDANKSCQLKSKYM